MANDGQTGVVTLREIEQSDLDVFFEHEQDPVAIHMAAFTAEDPTDRAAFMAHWTRIMHNDAIPIKTILLDGEVVGHVLSYEESGRREVSYWIGRDHWGKGIATQALADYLRVITTRSIYARAVKDNVGSIRVLEKCGFTIIGAEKGYANARGEEVEEYVLILN
jgi:RimJ/RimL family protein N-acetyltransferase